VLTLQFRPEEKKEKGKGVGSTACSRKLKI
jgi:hypothetical protein